MWDWTREAQKLNFEFRISHFEFRILFELLTYIVQLHLEKTPKKRTPEEPKQKMDNRKEERQPRQIGFRVKSKWASAKKIKGKRLSAGSANKEQRKSNEGASSPFVERPRRAQKPPSHLKDFE